MFSRPLRADAPKRNTVPVAECLEHYFEDPEKFPNVLTPKFTAVTRNMRGLFASQRSIRLKKFSAVKALNNFDIICLQETHGTITDLSTLLDTMPTHAGILNPDPNNPTGAGGVAMLFSIEFLRRYKISVPCDRIFSPGREYSEIFRSEVDLMGRLIFFTIRTIQYHFTVATVYFPATTDKARIDFLRVVKAVLPKTRHLFIGGDWNFSRKKASFKPDPRGELQISSSRENIGGTLARNFESFQQEFLLHEEGIEDGFTFRASRQSANEQGQGSLYVARLDRWYTSLSVADRAIFQIETQNHTGMNNKASDHLPVSFAIRERAKSQRQKLPQWTFRSKEIKQYVRDYYSVELMMPSSPEIGADQTGMLALSAALRSASLKVIRAGKFVARTVEAKLYVATHAWRLLSAGEITLLQVSKFKNQFPAVGECFRLDFADDDDDGVWGVDIARLRALVTELNIALADLQSRNLNSGDSSQDGGEIRCPLQTIKRLCPYSADQVINIVNPSNGEILRGEMGAEVLNSWWSQKWSADNDVADRPFGRRLLRRMARHRPVPEAARRVARPTEHEILGCLLGTRARSAPGPDGLPFAAWLVDVQLSTAVFYHVYDAMGEGSFEVANFNKQLIFFIPKKEPTVVHPIHGNCYHPKDTRPISVSTTFNRWYAGVFNSIFLKSLKEWFTTTNRGFVPGKQGAHNVIQVAEPFYEAVSTGHEGYLLLCDLEAAYPSISRGFILDALEILGFPPEWAAVLMGLFRDNHSKIVLGCGLYPGPKMESGIKQGCPWAPALFTFASELFFYLMREHLGPQEAFFVKTAYADDLALYIPHLDLCKRLPPVFAALRKATSLKLSVSKCSVLASTVGAEEAFRAEAPSFGWGDMKTPESAVYLGVLIGRDIFPDDIALNAFKKFSNRLNEWKVVPFSVGARIIIANVFLTSVFSYVEQFFIFSPSLISDIETALHNYIFPLKFLNKQAFLSLKEVCGISPQIVNIQHRNVAAVLRVFSELDCNIDVQVDAPIICGELRPSWIYAGARHLFTSITQKIYKEWIEEESKRKLFKKQAGATTLMIRCSLSLQCWTKATRRWGEVIASPHFPFSTLQCLRDTNYLSAKCRIDYIRYLCNGVATSRRIRSFVGLDRLSVDCKLCGDGLHIPADAELPAEAYLDSIEHFHECATVHAAALSLGLIFRGERLSPQHFCLIHPSVFRREPLWVAFVASVVRVRAADLTAPGVDSSEAIVTWYKHYTSKVKANKKLPAAQILNLLSQGRTFAGVRPSALFPGQLLGGLPDARKGFLLARVADQFLIRFPCVGGDVHAWLDLETVTRALWDRPLNTDVWMSAHRRELDSRALCAAGCAGQALVSALRCISCGLRFCLQCGHRERPCVKCGTLGAPASGALGTRITVFTDGSAKDDEAGWAMVALTDSQEIIGIVCGPVEEGERTNNYAELCGVQCAGEWLLTHGPTLGVRTVLLRPDSQLAIDAALRRNRVAPHLFHRAELLAELFIDVEDIFLEISFKRVASHTGVWGNELADKFADKGRQGVKIDAWYPDPMQLQEMLLL